MEHAVHDARATGVGQEFAVISDQPARRDMGNDAGFARTCRAHFGQVSFACTCDFFDHGTRIIIIHINGDFFDGFKALTVLFPHQNLGT